MKKYAVLIAFLPLFLVGTTLAQVTVSASVSDNNPKNLDSITYTITLTNPSTVTPAVGVFANCPVPRGIKLYQADAGQGNYDQNTGMWNVGSISPSSSVDLKLKCIVNYFNSAYDVREYYNYNILLKSNADFTGSSVGGKVAAGGNITAVGTSVGGLLPVLNPVPAVLNAKGYLNFTSGTVFRGNVVYGDSTNLPSANVLYPHGVLQQGTPFDFSAFSADITSLSLGLSTHITNGSSALASGKLTLTGSDIYLNVFSVAAADLSNADTVVFAIPKGSLGVVNVLGVSVDFSGDIEINGNLNNFILFNFPTASSLQITGSRWQGTILAPFATFNCIGTLIQGQVFADNMQTISSHDLSNFVGYIPLNRLINLFVNVSGGNSAIVPLTVNTTPPFGTGGNGNWSVSSVLPDSVWVLSLVRFDSNSVLAGTFAGRIYHVDNNGVADTLINSSMIPVSAIWSLAVSDSGHIFAATSSGLQRSNDTGKTWQTVLPLLDVRSVLIGQDSNMYAGTWGFGVYKSTDRGYSWVPRNQNIGSTVINALMDKVDTNALSTPHTLFAAAFQKGLSASWNSAQSWLPLAMPYEFVTAMGKTSTGILYLGTQLDGVYRSYDNGNTFHKLSGLPDAPVYSLKVDGDNNIFVSSWLNGIYASSDLGDTWTNLGLGGYGVSSLFALPNGSVLAGTSNGMIAKYADNVTGTGNEQVGPNEFALAQNYPNPFNPATTISANIATAGTYELTVFNILGQKIATLHQGYLAAGSKKFFFNGADLPSGIYLCYLRGNGQSFTRKMVLMK